MRFIHSEGPEQGINELTGRLTSELAAGKKVLWLVCGGSNIAAEAQVMKNISDDLSENLTVTLTDERYGDVGHKDSNWQQLREAGFSAKSGQVLAVLDGSTLERTVERYGQIIANLLQKNDVTIATFGIGADGHIAGILPVSPAAHETTDLATGYDSPPYTRLTLTFPALKQIDAAYAMAFGDSKRTALTRLRDEDIDLAEQPSQVLKRLPDAYLYSDQIGGSS